MLFIIQHQTSELWMKLMLTEIGAALQDARRPPAARLQEAGARQPHLRAAGGRLGRAGHHDPARVQRHPPVPGPVQRFSELQYRCIEFALGNKNAAMLKVHAHKPERLALGSRTTTRLRCTTRRCS
jgi:tryptophan 2,3-dioxygenase